MTQHHPPLSEVELLISRMVDHEADAGEVATLYERAGDDPVLYQQLNQSLADHARLSAHVQRDIARAVNVNLPASGEIARGPSSSQAKPAVIDLMWRSAATIGWAAVIALAVIFFGQDRAGNRDGELNVPSGRYIDRSIVEPHILQREDVQGQPLEPLPLQTKQLPDGTWEILWMHRSLERIVTDEFDPAWIRDPSETTQ
ncbi:MAG: hypothetical protein ACR2GY_11150 [Phycisphaerales bacterium]